jgi:hypothetical protein
VEALWRCRSGVGRRERTIKEKGEEAVKAHGIPNPMRGSKRARDKGFEVTVPKEFPNDE